MGAFGKTFKEILKAQKNAPGAFQILKTDDDKRLVFGWANVAVRTDGEQIVDLQQDRPGRARECRL